MKAGSFAVSAAQMQILYLAASQFKATATEPEKGEIATDLADRLRRKVEANERAGSRVTLNYLYCSAEQWDVLQLAVSRLAAADPIDESYQTLVGRLLLLYTGLTPCYDLACEECASRACDNCERSCCRDHSRQFFATTSVAGDCVQCEVCLGRRRSDSTGHLYERSYRIESVSHSSEGEI